MDFKERLTQMMLASRARQAPPQTTPRFVGGSGGGGIVGQGTTNINQVQSGTMLGASVDVGPIMKMFGYKEPEAWIAASKQAMDSYNKMPIEVREAYIKDPQVQRLLQKASDNGSPYAYFDPNTKYFKIPEMAPLAEATHQAGGQPTQATYLSGMAGEVPRAKAIEGYQMMNPTELTMFPKEYRDRLMAQIQDTLAQAKQRETQTQWIGPKAQSDIDLQSSQAVHQAAATATERGLLVPRQEKLTADANLDKQKVEDLKNGAAEQKALLTNQMVNFRGIENKLIGDMALAESDSIRRSKTAELGNHVLGHIAQVKAITKGNVDLAKGPAETYLTMSGHELQRMPMPKGWGGYPTLSPKDEQMLRIYHNDNTRILQELGSKNLSPGTATQILDNATEVAKRVKMTPDMQASLLKMIKFGDMIGYDTTALKNAFISRLPKPSTPEETAIPGEK